MRNTPALLPTIAVAAIARRCTPRRWLRASCSTSMPAGTSSTDPFALSEDGTRLAWITTDGATHAQLHVGPVGDEKSAKTFPYSSITPERVQFIDAERVLVVDRNPTSKYARAEVFGPKGRWASSAPPPTSALARWGGVPSLVTWLKTTSPKGATHTFNAWRLDTLKPLGKKVVLVENAEGRVPFAGSFYKPLYFLDGFATLVGQKRARTTRRRTSAGPRSRPAPTSSQQAPRGEGDQGRGRVCRVHQHAQAALQRDQLRALFRRSIAARAGQPGSLCLRRGARSEGPASSPQVRAGHAPLSPHDRRQSDRLAHCRSGERRGCEGTEGRQGIGWISIIWTPRPASSRSWCGSTARSGPPRGTWPEIAWRCFASTRDLDVGAPISMCSSLAPTSRRPRLRRTVRRRARQRRRARRRREACDPGKGRGCRKERNGQVAPWIGGGAPVKGATDLRASSGPRKPGEHGGTAGKQAPCRVIDA